MTAATLPLESPVARVARGMAITSALAVLLTAAAVTAAITPLSPVFGVLQFWVALVGGVVLGTLVAVLGTRFKFGPLTVTGITIVVYFAFGALLAVRSASVLGVVPSLDGLRQLAVGVVTVWRELLTVATPAGALEPILIAPYLLGLVGSVVCASIVLRARRPGWVALPVGGLLVLSILFGTIDAFWPAVIGVAITVGLASPLLRSRQVRADNLAHVHKVSVSRPIGVVVVLGAALAVGIFAGTVTPLPVERTVLRESVVPPLDIYDLPSPMTSFRNYTTGGTKMSLFTVTGLPAGASIRLATLDSYDGIVYRVSDGNSSTGQFARVGGPIKNSTVGTASRLTIGVTGLTGVWVPDTGYLSGLSLENGGATTQARRQGLVYNSATGTAVLTSGLQPGDQFAIDAVVPPQATDPQLANARVAAITVPTPQNVPDVVATTASKLTQGASTPYTQLKAIEKALHTQGYFSHGLAGEAPSRAGHTAERIAALLNADKMIGDDEQYAVAMALMAGQLGIPARVVMGFKPEVPSSGGPITVTGADVHAWVEVPFEGFGWVGFDPTPPKDQVPTDITPQQRNKPQPIVPQPPPPIVPPVRLPPAPPISQNANGPHVFDWALVGAIVGWTGIGIGILAVILAPAVILALIRRRRRRARVGAARSADRVSGSWRELVDLGVDHGAQLPRGGTRLEEADALAKRFPNVGAPVLAAGADAHVFGPGEPSPEEAAAYWSDVAAASKGIRSAAGWRRRLGARYYAPSLVHDIRAGTVRLKSRLGETWVGLRAKGRGRVQRRAHAAVGGEAA